MKSGIDFFPPFMLLVFYCFLSHNRMLSRLINKLNKSAIRPVCAPSCATRFIDEEAQLQQEKYSAFPDCLWTNHLTKGTSDEQSNCLGNYDSSYLDLAHVLLNKPLPFQTSCCLVSCEPERLYLNS